MSRLRSPSLLFFRPFFLQNIIVFQLVLQQPHRIQQVLPLNACRAGVENFFCIQVILLYEVGDFIIDQEIQRDVDGL